MMGLYCVKPGVQVEKVLLVKVTGVFEFGLYHWETICVCQMGDRTRMEQSCSEVLFGVVSAVYWSGFYSDGCGMDRTAQWRWEMVIAYDKDKAELGEKSAAAKLVIKWVGFNFFFKWTYYPENFFPQNSCFHYHQIHIRMRRVACQCFFFSCQCFVPGLEPPLFICLWEREMSDSEERMCSCNDTRLTALKLKSLFNFLSRVWEAAKEVPAHCFAPVLAGGARE